MTFAITTQTREHPFIALCMSYFISHTCLMSTLKALTDLIRWMLS